MAEDATPAETSGPASVTVDGYKITSSSETVKELTERFPSKEEKSDKTTASEAGRKGGEAAAAVRRSKAREEAKAQNDAPPAEGLAEEAEQEEPDTAEKLGKPRWDAKARMLEVAREAKEAKAERDRYRSELEQERQERQRLLAERPAERPEQKSVQANGKPKEDDFATYAEFIEALTEWKAESKLTEREQRYAQQRSAYEAHEGRIRGVEEARNATHEFIKANPDFNDRLDPEVAALMPTSEVARAEDFGPGNVIADEIIRAKADGPRLSLYLSDHPEEFQRLRELRTIEDVQLECRVIVRSLGAASTASAPKVQASKASPPLRPVNGSPHTAESEPGSDASYDEHRRYWNSKDRKSLAR